MGEKISVDTPFFNRVNIPIGLFLLLLTGVGPLIAWRTSSFESLKRAFLWPGVVGRGCVRWACSQRASALLRADVVRAVRVRAVTVVIEFFKGAKAIRSQERTEPAGRRWSS